MTEVKSHKIDKPMDRAPGPDADPDILKEWHKWAVYHFGTISYYTMQMTCCWCLSEEKPLTTPDVGVKLGKHKYCGDRCAQAVEAWRAALPKPVPVVEGRGKRGGPGPGRAQSYGASQTQAEETEEEPEESQDE